MLGNLNGMHLLILLAVVLLLFGATKLPALAKSMGQSVRLFKGEMKTMKAEEAPAEDLIVEDTAAETVEADVTVPVSEGRPSGVRAL